MPQLAAGALARWAAGGALLGAANQQGAYEREWTLGSLALAYLKIRDAPGADAAARASRRQSSAGCARSPRRSSRPTSAPGKTSSANNHAYWTGLAVGAAGVACQDRALFDWGIARARIGIAQVGADGTPAAGARARAAGAALPRLRARAAGDAGRARGGQRRRALRRERPCAAAPGRPRDRRARRPVELRTPDRIPPGAAHDAAARRRSGLGRALAARVSPTRASRPGSPRRARSSTCGSAAISRLRSPPTRRLAPILRGPDGAPPKLPARAPRSSRSSSPTSTTARSRRRSPSSGAWRARWGWTWWRR